MHCECNGPVVKQDIDSLAHFPAKFGARPDGISLIDGVRQCVDAD